ncbi:hypothetical protein GCM10027035_42630 [Emticicia sediminis]
MKKIFILVTFLIQINVFGQSSVLIEPNDGNGILSKNATTVTTYPTSISLPITGPGTRLMWIPRKSAFRVGTVLGTEWDDLNIGMWSFAWGYGAKANGERSLALGYNTIASGDRAVALGTQTTASSSFTTAMGISTVANGYTSTSMGDATTASGSYSTAMGSGTLASGYVSTSMGNLTTASGSASTSIGSETTASGFAAVAIGFNTTAQAQVALALGKYNIVSGTTDSWVASEPLLIVGNGTDNANRNNAFTLLKNSNLGLNTATPQFQLTFKDDLGDKISLYGGNLTNTTNHYGLGIQSAKLQIFTKSDNDDVVFGYGRSAAFTENVRFKGTGLVGIGVSTPSELLDVNGRMRVRHRPGNTAGVWMSNDVNSTAVGDGAFYGLKSNTEAGIFIGGAWRFGLTNTGNMTVGGTVTASCGVLVCSDLRYKKNIRSLNNSLENILKINGVRYDFKKEEFPERNFSDKNQIGFIAQEIEKIFPEMVFTDEKGYKSVDYARLTPVLVEALKEQQQMIDQLKSNNSILKTKNEKLESRLDKIEAVLYK